MSNIFDQMASSQTSLKKKNTESKKNFQENSDPKSNFDNEYQPTQEVKQAAQQIMKYGVVEMANKEKLYQFCIREHLAINQILSLLNLNMKIDDVRGLVYLVILTTHDDLNNFDDQDDMWKHPLIRKQRMNLEQSLLVAILRQHFVAHELDAGIGDQKASVHLDELLPQLNQFLGDKGSDVQNLKRVRNLLEQLRGYGLVSEIDSYEKLIIRPLIAHVANPENLKALVAALKIHRDIEQVEEQK
jgi:hypothetical protein